MSQWIDLSHTIHHGLETYRGLPEAHICDFWTREESEQFYDSGESFQIAKIEMVSNTGTYIDFPFHRYADGEDLSMVGPERLAGIEGIKIDCGNRKGRAVEKHFFENKELEGKAVLIQTNWDKHWNTDAYHSGGPYLTEETASYLASKNVKMVGIDAHNIDDTEKKRRPVHSLLLAKGIFIVEHMTNLLALPEHGFEFFAVPPKIVGVGSFPVRAMAKLV